MQIATALQSLQNTQVGALISGNEARWNAMHAPPPIFPRETPPAVVPPPRFVRREGILNRGLFRAGPPMLNRRLRPDEFIKDPRAMHHAAINPRPCMSLATHTRCARNAVTLGAPLSTFTAQTFKPLTIGGLHPMSTTPTVQPFQYEADTTSASTAVVYTGGIESGALARTMDSAPANGSATQSLSYTAANTLVSFAWVSPANVPNSTSWPAQNYTVSLNITQANPNIMITAVRVLRVDSTGGGGGGDEGLAEVGGLANLTQTLANTGMLTFTIPGSAQTATTSDRVAVKVVVKSTASGTQTFSYLAGQNSGSGVNVVQPYSLQADTMSGPTGVVYTNGTAETGALSRVMDSVSTNAAADQQLTYSGSSGPVSFAWVSQPTFPNSTSWPAQTYTVTLNVTQPNPNITITAVRLLRVDSTGGGGGGDEGLALVGGLTNLSQSLANTGILKFTISGTAQTASATDRLAVKVVLNNSAAGTQSFSYSAGQNSGSGVNLPAQGVLSGSTTGMNPWWTYEEGALPGHGKYMVNVGNGNLLVQTDDEDIPERGIDLAFRRTYNAQSTHDSNNTDGSVPSNYGDGWTNTFDAHLAYDGANTISVSDIDGARYDYTADGNGNWVHPAGQYATLKWDGQCGYYWTKKTGTTYYFYSPDLNETSTCPLSTVGAFPNDTAYGGRLYKIWGRNSNNSITFAYAWTNNDASSAANISTITATHADSQALTLTFGKQFVGAPTELRSITRPDGKVISYQYDSITGSTLQAVTLPGNNVTQVTESYTYNANHQLASTSSPRYNASNADGDVTYFNYDSSNRLTKAYDQGVVNFQPGTGPFPSDGLNTMLQSGAPSGLQTWHTTNFSGYGTGTTSMTDSDGHSSIWSVDSQSRVTQTQDYTGESSPTYLVTSATWDSNNNLIETVDARVYATDYAYDANGNTIAVAQPSVTSTDGTFRPTSLYSYDGNNDLIAYCDPHKVGPAGYDWANRPQSDTLCTALGSGSTQYTWLPDSTNEPFGCLTETDTPLGYHVSIQYTSPSTCSNGLPTQVKGDAISQTSDTLTPSRQPLQTFAYDSFGNLTSYGNGNGTTTLTYDTTTTKMNRLLSVTDADGYTSYRYYYDNGQMSKTETTYQHATGTGPTMSYDADGDLTQETAYHGGVYNGAGSLPTLPSALTQTVKYYDGADRLVEVKQGRDASGAGEAYTNPWITRYLYDLSNNHTVTSALPTIGGQTVWAFGNLFKTEELDPSSDEVTISSSAPSAVNGTLRDIKGNAFDALDRAVTRYFYVVQNGADTLQHETYTYDAANPIAANMSGELSSVQNGLSQSTYYAYDSDGKLQQTQHTASPALDRTFTFDADGRTKSVSVPNFGTPQQYSYDSDGRLTQTIEPSGMESAATITYEYYADGTRKALDVQSSALNQTGLFVYAYRPDGKLETQQINQSGNVLVGTTTLTFKYSNAGRLNSRAESGPGGNATPTMFQYNSTYGFLSETDFPGGNKESNIQFDPSGAALGQTSNWFTSTPSTYVLTVRGELRQSTGPISTNQPPPSVNVMANGVAVNTNYKVSKTLTTTSWSATVDPRMGVALGSTATDSGYDEADTGVGFDQIGRAVTDGSDSIPGPSCDTCKETDSATARSYDQENHVSTTNLEQCQSLGGCTPTSYANATYDWGAEGHPIRIGMSYKGSATAYETLHWAGNQLLFTTHGGAVDDIKIGEIGDITPQDSTYKGLTFWDRDISSNVVYCHNATGAAGNGTPAFPYSTGFTNYSVEYTHNPCAVYTGESMTVPSNMFWGSVAYNMSSGSAPMIGSGGLLTMPRGDGFNDGVNIVQGVRIYDSTLGGWSTPDAYQGEVHDPMSQKGYVWNRGNAASYEDPSGFAALTWDANAQSGGAVNDGASIVTADVDSGGKAHIDAAWIASNGNPNSLITNIAGIVLDSVFRQILKEGSNPRDPEEFLGTIQSSINSGLAVLGPTYQVQMKRNQSPGGGSQPLLRSSNGVITVRVSEAHSNDPNFFHSVVVQVRPLVNGRVSKETFENDRLFWANGGVMTVEMGSPASAAHGYILWNTPLPGIN